MINRRNAGLAARVWAVGFGVGLGLAAGWAAAVEAARASGEPAKLTQCISCHGADGRPSVAMVPILAGQPKVFLENTLIMIREGLRPVPVKQGLLDGVSDAEVGALADYFSRQTATMERPARDQAAFIRGQALASQGLCGTCHLPNFAGQQQMPRLAGQAEAYLSHSMKRFRDNQAEGRDTMMNGVLRGLGDGAVADLAHYFSQLR
jgi:cytochrome c553